MPAVARPWSAPPQLACDPGPEFQNPAPHRFIGNLQASLGEEFLNVAVAQREPEIKPNRVLDDRRRETMSAVGELTHAGSLPYQVAHSNSLSVTMPPGLNQQSSATKAALDTYSKCSLMRGASGYSLQLAAAFGRRFLFVQ